MNTTELPGLLQACKEEPTDDGPRLILADWLEEHGDPDRAEHVRLSVLVGREGLPRLVEAACRTRITTLERKHSRRWLGSLRKQTHRSHFSFDRGLVRVHLGWARDPIRLAKSLCESEEVGWVEAGDGGVMDEATFCRMIEEGGLAPFTNWTTWGPVLNAATIEALGRMTHRLSHLRAMVIDCFQVPGANLEPLLASGALTGLRSLQFAWGILEESGGVALGRPGRLPHLRDLQLLTPNLTEPGLAALLEGNGLESVERLTIRDEKLKPRTATHLVEGSLWPRLRELSLMGCSLDSEAWRRLGTARVGQLERFHLSGCRVGLPNLRKLAAAPWLQTVERLEMTDCAMGPDHIARLVRSPHLGRLRDLSLTENRLSPEGLAKLLVAPWLAGLRSLQLVDNRIGAVAQSSLASAPFANLETLDLGDNDLRAAGMKGLASNPSLQNLRYLGLNGTRPTAQGIRALTGSAALSSLRHLELPRNGLRETTARDLLAWPGLRTLSSLHLVGNSIPVGLARSIQRLLGRGPARTKSLPRSPRRNGP